MSRFGRKRAFGGPATFDLNMMPFIDIFSLLCTFLLFSAAFISIGIHIVEVPFLSNAAPKETSHHTRRIINLTVSLSKSSIAVTTTWSKVPLHHRQFTFARSDTGISRFEEKLKQIKAESPNTDAVSLYIDDDLNYAQIIPILDSLKLGRHGIASVGEQDSKSEEKTLFPKIVFSSVVL